MEIAGPFGGGKFKGKGKQAAQEYLSSNFGWKKGKDYERVVSTTHDSISYEMVATPGQKTRGSSGRTETVKVN